MVKEKMSTATRWELYEPTSFLMNTSNASLIKCLNIQWIHYTYPILSPFHLCNIKSFRKDQKSIPKHSCPFLPSLPFLLFLSLSVFFLQISIIRDFGIGWWQLKYLQLLLAKSVFDYVKFEKEDFAGKVKKCHIPYFILFSINNEKKERSGNKKWSSEKTVIKMGSKFDYKSIIAGESYLKIRCGVSLPPT